MKGHLYTVSSRNAFESVQERWTVTRPGVCGPSRTFSHHIVPVLTTDTTDPTRESKNFSLMYATVEFNLTTDTTGFFFSS